MGILMWTAMYFGVLLIALIPLAIYLYCLIVKGFFYRAPYLLKFIAQDRAKLQLTMGDAIRTSSYYRVNNQLEYMLNEVVKA